VKPLPDWCEARQGRRSGARRVPPALFLLLLIPGIAGAAPPEVAWRTHTGDRAAHGAALLDGGLYVADSRKITELDPGTGAIRRFLIPPDPTLLSSRPLFADGGALAGDAAGRLVRWVTDGPAVVFGALRRAAPVTALRVGGERLLAGDAAGCVTVLDPGAVKVWSHCTSGAIGRALVPAGDLVLAGDASGRITAWTAGKGGYRWAYQCDAALSGPPMVDGDTVLVSGVDGHVYALDRARGALRWRAHAGDRIHGAAAIGGGLVIVATEARGLVAINVATGRAAWRSSLPATKASPAVLGDLVVVGASDHALHAFVAASGKRRWRVAAPGAVLAPPLSHGAAILAVTEDGIAFLLR
jgi:hypothetical protein